MTPVAAVEDLAPTYDLVVVGAGPAGLSAAASAAELGLSVLLADENLGPGGQIYRAITSTPVTRRATLGEDYWHGAHIVKRLERSPAYYAARCSVWLLGPNKDVPGSFEVGLSLGGKARILEARQIVLATGAQERPFPIPGWTLPGVMTAGAAQIALKSSGIIPAGRTVIAGCGPLLYLLANQLLAAGAIISVVLDTTPYGNWPKAFPALPEFLFSPYLRKGLKLMATVHRKLRFVSGVHSLQARGEERLVAVTVASGRRQETIPCDTLLLHQGVIPSVSLSIAAGCALDYDEIQSCWVPRVDTWFRSSITGIYVAGDGAGIGGAESAALRGEIAGLAAALQLGYLRQADFDKKFSKLHSDLSRLQRGRRFLDLLYKPAPQFMAPTQDETIVCRCEEVTAGQVRSAASRFDVSDPNQMKHFLRCGMGPCQSRQCGPTVMGLIAATHNISPAKVGYFRQRPPVKPITLAELATLPRSKMDPRAVIE